MIKFDTSELTEEKREFWENRCAWRNWHGCGGVICELVEKACDYDSCYKLEVK